MTKIHFFVINSIVFFILNLFSYLRLSKSSYPWMRFIPIVLYILEVGFFIRQNQIASGWLHDITIKLYTVGAVSVAASFMLFLFIIVNMVVTKAIDTQAQKVDNAKRTGMRKMLDVSVLFLLFTSVAKGFYNSKNILITRWRVEMDKKMQGPLRIAMISDVHIGEYLKKDYMQKIVDEINAQEPDIVVIVGDLADLEADMITEDLIPIRQLRTRYGAYYVLGNHEYYHGVPKLINLFRENGLTVLENENKIVGGLNIVGVNDIIGYKFKTYEPNFDKAFDGIDRKLPTVLLTHQPKSVKYFNQKPDLVLSGHTHAGQIFPFTVLVWMDQKYVYGHYKLPDYQMIVSSGAGFWGPPVRVLTKSEIVVIDMYPKKYNPGTQVAIERPPLRPLIA